MIISLDNITAQTKAQRKMQSRAEFMLEDSNVWIYETMTSIFQV